MARVVNPAPSSPPRDLLALFTEDEEEAAWWEAPLSNAEAAAASEGTAGMIMAGVDVDLLEELERAAPSVLEPSPRWELLRADRALLRRRLNALPEGQVAQWTALKEAYRVARKSWDAGPGAAEQAEQLGAALDALGAWERAHPSATHLCIAAAQRGVHVDSQAEAARKATATRRQRERRAEIKRQKMERARRDANCDDDDALWVEADG